MTYCNDVMTFQNHLQMSLRLTSALLVITVLVTSLPGHVRCLNLYSADGSFFRSHDQLLEVPDDIPDAAKQVDLGYNQIIGLRENSFQALSQCTHLNLWWNQISTIEAGSFSGLYSCTELFLSNNKLTQVRFNMFIGLESIEKLHLNDNGILSVQDGAFSGMRTLRDLWLSNNKLQVLQYALFRGLTNLKDLKLWGNQIKDIQGGTFSSLVNLRELWMAGNVLQEIKYGSFIGLESLQKLYLGWNQISGLEDDAFSSMRNLSVLDLQNNLIPEVSGRMLAGLVSMETLILKNNRLPRLRANTLVGMPRPLTVALSHNPLICDCELCWLLDEELNGSVVWDETSRDDSRPQCLGAVKWEKWVCPGGGLDCPDLGAPVNGSSQGNAPFTCNSVVTYSCDEGYWLAGSPSLACRNNGTWSGRKPECRKKLNSKPATPTPATAETTLGDAIWIGLIIGVAVVCSVISAFVAVCVYRTVIYRKNTKKAENSPEIVLVKHEFKPDLFSETPELFPESPEQARVENECQSAQLPELRQQPIIAEHEFTLVHSVTRVENTFPFPNYKGLNSIPEKSSKC